MYPGHIPCFLQRNVNRVNKRLRANCVKMPKRRRRPNNFYVWQCRKSKPCKETKEFFFKFKNINAKRVASGDIEHSQAKRLCLEPKISRVAVGENTGKHQVIRPGVGLLDSEQLNCQKAGSRQVERCLEHDNSRSMLGERGGQSQAKSPVFELSATQPFTKRTEGRQAKRLCIERDHGEKIASERADRGYVKEARLRPQNARHQHTVGKVGNDQRLYQSVQKQSLRKGNPYNYHSDYSNLLVDQNDSNFDSVFECDDFSTESEAMETLTDDESRSKKESSPKHCLKKTRSCHANHWQTEDSVFQRPNNKDNLYSEFDKSQMIHKSELSKNKETGRERLASRDALFRDSSHQIIDLSSEVFVETMDKKDLDFNSSQAIYNKRKNLVGRPTSMNLKQSRRSINSEDMFAKTLRVSLIDCFSSGLQAKQTLNQVSFQPTSTPKPARVKSSSQEAPFSATIRTVSASSTIPTSQANSKVSTSHTARKVTPYPIISKAPKSHIMSRVPTSDITPGVRKSHISSKIPSSMMTPPESEASCPEDENFTKREKFKRNKFWGSSKASSKSERTLETIVYRPLFSSKPRPWKSVVVENAS